MAEKERERPSEMHVRPKHRTRVTESMADSWLSLSRWHMWQWQPMFVISQLSLHALLTYHTQAHESMYSLKIPRLLMLQSDRRPLSA